MSRAICRAPRSRTQSTGRREVSFHLAEDCGWAQSGTAVCRIYSAKGNDIVRLPLSARAPTLGKFQGLSQDDVMYLIMPTALPMAIPRMMSLAKRWFSRSFETPRIPRRRPARNSEPLAVSEGPWRDNAVANAVVKERAAQDYHGYGAVDLYAVDPHLGALKDYQDSLPPRTSRNEDFV